MKNGIFVSAYKCREVCLRSPGKATIRQVSQAWFAFNFPELYWEQYSKSACMGRHRAHTIHTGLSVCELYTGTPYAGTIHLVLSGHASSSTPRLTCLHACYSGASKKWLCSPRSLPSLMVGQEGSQVQLLLRCGSVRVKPVKKYATLLIHFAALDGPASAWIVEESCWPE